MKQNLWENAGPYIHKLGHLAYSKQRMEVIFNGDFKE